MLVHVFFFFLAKTVKERLENVLPPAASSITTSTPVGSLTVWGGEPSQPKGTVAVRSICWGGGSESGAQQHQSQSESCWVPETEPRAGAVWFLSVSAVPGRCRH